ncbi:MAG: hypothetical protein SO369_00825, partial [Treponema sp.]|nr:hypothetical protein [Treponema sp.]
QAACGGFDDHHHSRHKRQLEHHMENLTGGTPPVRYLPCVVPCKLYFIIVKTIIFPSRYSTSPHRIDVGDGILLGREKHLKT